MRRMILSVLAVCLAIPVAAQEPQQPTTAAQWLEWVPDPAELEMPVLSFEMTEEIADEAERYFYFARADTSFAEALGDVRECDLRARGLWQGDAIYGLPTGSAVDPGETMFAAIAGPVLAYGIAALAAPADARRERRYSLRRCMFFKGYSRFALPENLFLSFNYEATDKDMSEEERQGMLARQALVAASARPQGQELGL